jgi:hypothetical protein
MQEVYSNKFETFQTIDFFDFNVLEHKEKENEIDVFDIFGNTRLRTSWAEKSTNLTKEYFELNKKNTLCTLTHKRLSIFVVKNEDKVTLKYFMYSRTKRVGEVFYRVSTTCHYVSYNVKRNCLYVGKIINFHKKRKALKHVKIHTFDRDIVTDTITIINLWYNHVFEDRPERKINNIFGHNAVKEFLANIPGVQYHTNKISSQTIYKTILTKKGVKLCDNWPVFTCMYPQPKTKDYKKNGPKYLDSIMELNAFSGDKIKRILHKLKNFNPNLFKTAVNFFGKDYMLGQSDETLIDIFESTCDNEFYVDFSMITSKKERNNIFEIFKLVAKGEVDVHTYIDHFRFIRNIRRFEHVKWSSATYDDFREEHLNLTELNQYYTKGTFTRIYGDRFIDYISNGIKYENDTYYPEILKTSKDYNLESFVQSNCVKGYVQRASALIVSLRKNDKESKERLTVEYRISMGHSMQIDRVQTRGRFNQDPGLDWSFALEVLDGRMNSSLVYNLFELPKIVCKVGNKEFISNSIFEDPIRNTIRPTNIYNLLKSSQDLIWEDKNITNIDYAGNDIVTILDDDLNF